MASRVTGADVARAAGVSRATVSYVLNDTPNQKIPEHTRRRVRDAAERLGYSPSAAARTLRRGRSDIVLLVLPRWPIGHTVGQLIEVLGRELVRHDLTLLVHQLTDGEDAFTALWRTVSPAAVVAAEPFGPANQRAMRAAGIPVAFALFEESPGRRGALTSSQIRVGRLQVEHLAVTGHRRLGYALPDDPDVRSFSTPRLEGARIGCIELGLDLPHVEIVSGDRSPVAAVSSWREGPEPVTAVCAYNDETAFAVLRAMDDLGLSAPDDLAVIGVDDIPVARHAHPPLTTISVGQAAIARYTTEVIVADLAGSPRPAPPGSDALALILRDSA